MVIRKAGNERVLGQEEGQKFGFEQVGNTSRVWERERRSLESQMYKVLARGESFWLGQMRLLDLVK